MDNDLIDNGLSPALRRMYDVYLENIFRGCTAYESALRAGIARERVTEWIRLAEVDSYVIARKAFLSKNFKAENVWNVTSSVLTLAAIAFDVNERGANRVQAIKELNVLCGITIIDEDGRTRAGNSLSDFYAAISAMKNGPSASASATDVPPKSFFD